MKKFISVMVALFLLLPVSFPSLAVTFSALATPVFEEIDPGGAVLTYKVRKKSK